MAGVDDEDPVEEFAAYAAYPPLRPTIIDGIMASQDRNAGPVPARGAVSEGLVGTRLVNGLGEVIGVVTVEERHGGTPGRMVASMIDEAELPLLKDHDA